MRKNQMPVAAELVIAVASVILHPLSILGICIAAVLFLSP